MARRFAKVLEFFDPSDLVNTKTTIPLRVGEERWIYTSTLRVSVYIHHYSPPLWGIVVYYCQRYVLVNNNNTNRLKYMILCKTTGLSSGYYKTGNKIVTTFLPIRITKQTCNHFYVCSRC